MARLRVFISSTFYDMKHIRSSLEQFIDTLGYEPILSEKGTIAFDPALPLDESCYREVRNCDIFVLIIGGRYGSAASVEGRPAPKDFFERYSSITRREYEAASERDTPIYILVDRAVYNEYETFKRNRDAKNIVYAHVDSVNVFLLIDQILSQRRNNPLHQFDRHSEIAAWLRDQWGGLFKEILASRSRQRELSTLADHVSGLSEISTTLKRYLEEVVSRVSERKMARALIDTEEKRLAETRRLMSFSQHPWIQLIVERDKLMDLESARLLFSKAKTIEEIAEAIQAANSKEYQAKKLIEFWSSKRGDSAVPVGYEQINKAREILGLSAIDFASVVPAKTQKPRKRTRKVQPVAEPDGG